VAEENVTNLPPGGRHRTMSHFAGDDANYMYRRKQNLLQAITGMKIPPLMPGFHHCCFSIAYLFAVYGCNEMKFSYIIFTEQRNFTMAER